MLFSLDCENATFRPTTFSTACQQRHGSVMTGGRIMCKAMQHNLFLSCLQIFPAEPFHRTMLENCFPKVESELYHNGIILNNVGVRLLERRCYAQAVDCFEHASAIMNQIAFSTLLTNLSRAEEHVNRSMRHLTYPQPSTVAIMIIEVLTTTEEGYLVKGECSAPDFMVLDSVLGDAPTLHVAYPIRIEICCNPLPVDNSLRKRQAAIVSHNLGIAFLCLCKSTSPSLKNLNKEEQSIRNFSLCLSQRSCTILMQQLWELRWREPCQNYITASLELARLLIAVLNSLIQVQHEISDYKKALQWHGVLQQIRLLVSEQQSQCRSMKLLGGHFNLSAAAAAA